MRIVTIIGNRPQVVKAAAVSRLLRERHEELIVHTGQHYDPELSDVFFDQLEVPPPDRNLEINSGSNIDQLARMLPVLEGVIRDVDPQLVLVYGDTNSTLAGALVAADAGVPIAHVEAGMRSFDSAMPEERNRVLTDHLSSLLLCSTETAVQNLAREGIEAGVTLVGDVMADVALTLQPRARANTEYLEELALSASEYALCTVHRAGNVDDERQLERVVSVLEALPLPVVLPLHPRTRARLSNYGHYERLEQLPSLRLVDPLGYYEFATLLCNARVLLTDSGGAQKEAYVAQVPCITLREQTEWAETVDSGWNVLTGLDRDAVLAALERPLPSEHPDLYGNGEAGRRVAEAIGRFSP